MSFRDGESRGSAARMWSEHLRFPAGSKERMGCVRGRVDCRRVTEGPDAFPATPLLRCRGRMLQSGRRVLQVTHRMRVWPKLPRRQFRRVTFLSTSVLRFNGQRGEMRSFPVQPDMASYIKLLHAVRRRFTAPEWRILVQQQQFVRAIEAMEYPKDFEAASDLAAEQLFDIEERAFRGDAAQSLRSNWGFAVLAQPVEPRACRQRLAQNEPPVAVRGTSKHRPLLRQAARRFQHRAAERRFP